ncbi:MAG: sulfatase [Phycisphaerae bacterium]|nr:sulfatase [Phycisphaerae bacterium]
MQRREFIKIMGISAIGLATGCGNVRAAVGIKKPNLLVIQTDEHNFRTLGCYRDTLSPEQAFMWGPKAIVETPNIDFLAKNGALCTRFYATTPVCSPSRGSLISGQYPYNTPVNQNDIALNDDVISFAELMAKDGYSTGYAGKWHLNGPPKPEWAPSRKFGFNDNRYMFNRGHWKKLELTANGPRIGAKNAKGNNSYDVDGADEKSFTTDWLADRTIEFVKANKDKSFCYMLAIPDPHGPDTVRKPYDTMFDNLDYQQPRTYEKFAKNPPSWDNTPKAGPRIQSQSKYFGMVKCIDDNIGKILKYLKDNNLMDNTIIVFTSDHGDMRSEHRRQNKSIPQDGSAKVPFIIYYPKKIKAGTIIHEAMGCVDFLPTMLALTNTKTAGKEEGRDYSQLFIDGKAPAGWKDITFFRGTGYDNDNWVAAATKRYKLVTSPIDEPWLYDLEKDPDEQINFYTDPAYRETAKFLASEMLAYAKKYNDPRYKRSKIQADLTWSISGTGPFVPASQKDDSKQKDTRHYTG